MSGDSRPPLLLTLNDDTRAPLVRLIRDDDYPKVRLEILLPGKDWLLLAIDPGVALQLSHELSQQAGQAFHARERMGGR